MASRWFVHVDVPVAWPVVDPIEWCLTHRHTPLLRPAQPMLDACLLGDDSVALMTVLERCRMNLVSFEGGDILVRHSGPDAIVDVRLVASRLLRRGPWRSLRFRDERTATQAEVPSSRLRWGTPLPADWPIPMFARKWRARHRDDDDDRSPIPYQGDGLAGAFPGHTVSLWRDLKALWNSQPVLRCRNCNRFMYIVATGCASPEAFRWHARQVYGCFACKSLHVRDPQRHLWLDQNQGRSPSPPGTSMDDTP